ncbi:hypothetical protein STAQ_10690 [Allostella sp. ATCC 35155]|nr:hypothetical protein STAQ_10690 [Stella sp. ATCC 35155]
MKTEDLIRAIAADHHPAPPVAGSLAAAMAGGIAIAALLFATGLGVRGDIGDALGTVRFLLKPAETLLLAAGAWLIVLRLARPEGTRGLAPLLPGLVLVGIAVAGELATAPPGEWSTRLVGSNALVCMVAIPAMAAGPLAALLLALRRAAPARPALLGAAAGLLSGALAGTLYAIHCPDDSPLFVVTWFGLAIALTTATGGLAGRRWLRW